MLKIKAINLVKKHQKPTKENKGGIISKESVIHYSNVKNLEQKINGINNKIKNKSFLKNAPKLIIHREKKALVDRKIELKKLNSILNSIKN